MSAKWNKRYIELVKIIHFNLGNSLKSQAVLFVDDMGIIHQISCSENSVQDALAKAISFGQSLKGCELYGSGELSDEDLQVLDKCGVNIVSRLPIEEDVYQELMSPRDVGHKNFMAIADHIKSWSKDRSRKVSALIVDNDNIIRQTGYNGFPRLVNDNEESRHKAPLKYKWTEHAERNAIFNAARLGTSVANCRMYIPWYPCMDCARAIWQSGIKKIVAREPNWDDRKWGQDFKMVREFFDEVGFEVVWLNLSEEGCCGQ